MIDRIDRIIKARRERLEGIQALQDLYETEIGKKAINYIISLTHMMETSRSDSPEDTYFAEGERQIGIQICNALKINIEEQFKIFYEQQGE